VGLIKELLHVIPQGDVVDVTIGLHWTMVEVQVDGARSCGLASTVSEPHGHGRGPDVPQAGSLREMPAQELAAMAASEMPAMASVGVATINALLPKDQQVWQSLNAEHVISDHGAEKIVTIVGSFPFIPRLREKVGELHVLERQPRSDLELPESAAPDVIPLSDVVAITSMTFINHSLERLLGLCRPDALVLLMGPSTPMSPILFSHGVDMLSGSIVEHPEQVNRSVREGGTFRQVHQAGVRLVTVNKSDF
jgi:uncharacterized protein (DUF4213/DUF364 family)